MAQQQQRPLVGVGVLVFQPGTTRCLVGKRKGSHGAGEWALPGGHLEFGESFEECAAREVLEEAGLPLVSPSYAYAVNSVFPGPAGDTLHYVTVFVQAEAQPGAQPANLEPHKCEGWEWVEFSELQQRCSPLFLPLATLTESSWSPI